MLLQGSMQKACVGFIHVNSLKSDTHVADKEGDMMT